MEDPGYPYDPRSGPYRNGLLAGGPMPGGMLGAALSQPGILQQMANTPTLAQALRGADISAPMGLMMGMVSPTPSRLPMDLASRMGRATEMGHTVPAWHGGGADIRAFMQGAPRNTGGGMNTDAFFFGDTPRTASRYAQMAGDHGLGNPVVYPVMLRAQNPLVLGAADFERLQSAMLAARQGQPLTEMQRVFLEDALSAAARRPYQSGVNPLQWVRDQGFDSIRKLPGRAGAEGEIAVFEPSQIRSIFAAFDPARRGSSDILASTLPFAALGGAGLLGAQGGQQ